MTDRLGQQFGQYRLGRFLGQGSFGEVYLGEHIHHNNTLAAVKVLQARLTAEDLKEFINEASTTFRLQHPHIVRLLDFGIGPANTPFLAMAYAPNGTLRQRHPKGTHLSLDSIIAYVRPIAAALQHAHDERLIHRDVKPENILLGPNNEVWLSDFGITSVAYSSPAVANGVVYVGSDDDKLYAFKANGCGQPTCSPLWTASVGSAIWSSPAVANGVVYVGS